jgi:carbonic anhydrase
MDIVYRYDPHLPLRDDTPRTSSEALERLASGNRHFSDIVRTLQQATAESKRGEQFVIPVDLVSLGVPFVEGQMPEQNPFAIVLSCSDARAPVEQIFNCVANDLFTVRVAGNVLGLECLGSVDYAVAKLADSLRTAIVLGHTGCGAVTAAVDMYLAPNEFMNVAFSHAVRSLVDRIMLAVRAASRALDDIRGSTDHEAPEYRDQLLAASVFLNAALTAFDLRREIHAQGGHKIGIAYSVYDLAMCRASASPYDGEADSVFLPAPEDSAALFALARDIAERIIVKSARKMAPSKRKKKVKKRK